MPSVNLSSPSEPYCVMRWGRLTSASCAHVDKRLERQHTKCLLTAILVLTMHCLDGMERCPEGVLVVGS